MEFGRRNPELIVVLASSMGQTSIDYGGSYEGFELELADFSRLATCIGLKSSDYRELLAMQPQSAVEISDPEVRDHASRVLGSSRTAMGQWLFKVKEMTTALSISIALPKKADVDQGFCQINGNRYSWKEAEIEVHHIDAGTGYHTHEGAMAVYGEGIAADARREILPTNRAKGLMMKLAGGFDERRDEPPMVDVVEAGAGGH